MQIATFHGDARAPGNALDRELALFIEQAAARGDRCERLRLAKDRTIPILLPYIDVTGASATTSCATMRSMSPFSSSEATPRLRSSAPRSGSTGAWPRTCRASLSGSKQSGFPEAGQCYAVEHGLELLGLGSTGRFDPKALRKLAGPDWTSRRRIPLLSLGMRGGATPYWNRLLKSNGAFTRRFDRSFESTRGVGEKP